MNRTLEVFNVVTLITVVLVVTGAIMAYERTLTWHEYFGDMKWLLGLVGIGRGLAATGRVTP